MRKVHVFDNVSLDGFFTDAKNDMSWAHKHDEEWNAFASSNASGPGELLFGRVTYEMMAAFWPTPQAAQMLPQVAAGMNAMRKTVFSRTLERVTWQNTTLMKGDLVTEVTRLKEQPGPDLVILGSGSLVSQLTEARLIDEYQIVVNPIVLGRGRTLFATVDGRMPLALTRTRAFKNGSVVLWYEPASS
ncbi:MAG TPA: dihydrofolate reductase family protein [Vicinamibacterales bacterium]|nr:dihydrofolate reductase family protein [Vicinamibacterales bacterium]